MRTKRKYVVMLLVLSVVFCSFSINTVFANDTVEFGVQIFNHFDNDQGLTGTVHIYTIDDEYVTTVETDQTGWGYTNLSAGKYYATIVSIQEGYYIFDDDIEYFEIISQDHYDTGVLFLGVSNDHIWEEDSYLDLTVADQNGNGISGFTFELYFVYDNDDDQGVLDYYMDSYTTDEDGNIFVADLPNDSDFKVINVKAPSGYELLETKTFSVGEVETVVIKYVVEVGSVSPANFGIFINNYFVGEILMEAKIDIYNEDGDLVRTYNKVDGYIEGNLPDGYYTVVATSLDNDYYILYTERSLLIDEYNAEAIQYTNFISVPVGYQANAEGSVIINVKDQNGTPLKGFEFMLYMEYNGIEYLIGSGAYGDEPFVTDEEGNIYAVLNHSMNYRLVNTKATNGYDLLATQYINLKEHEELELNFVVKFISDDNNGNKDKDNTTSDNTDDTGKDDTKTDNTENSNKASTDKEAPNTGDSNDFSMIPVLVISFLTCVILKKKQQVQ